MADRDTNHSPQPHLPTSQTEAEAALGHCAASAGSFLLCSPFQPRQLCEEETKLQGVGPLHGQGLPCTPSAGGSGRLVLPGFPLQV